MTARTDEPIDEAREEIPVNGIVIVDGCFLFAPTCGGTGQSPSISKSRRLSGSVGPWIEISSALVEPKESPSATGPATFRGSSCISNVMIQPPTPTWSSKTAT